MTGLLSLSGPSCTSVRLGDLPFRSVFAVAPSLDRNSLAECDWWFARQTLSWNSQLDRGNLVGQLVYSSTK